MPFGHVENHILPTNAQSLNALTGGWQRGKPPTAETIRQGTVRMEEHPDYKAAMQKARSVGFEIRFSGEASIEWTELYDLDQNFVRIEKIMNVAKGMRFIDLEHELGHIDQFTTRFGDKVPPLQKKIELPSGHRRNVDVLAGIITIKLQIIVEYHNRLVEFIRLYERRVDIDILKDHAKGYDGVESWKKKYNKKGINNSQSITGMRFMNQYFPDIPELEEEYEQAIQSIK